MRSKYKRDNPDPNHARELRSQRNKRYQASLKLRNQLIPTGVAGTSGSSMPLVTPSQMDAPPLEQQGDQQTTQPLQCHQQCVTHEPREDSVTYTTHPATYPDNATDATSTSVSTNIVNQIQTAVVGEGIASGALMTTTNTNGDPYNFVYDGIPAAHRLLKDRSPCHHCGAKLLQFEFPTFCCMNGKTVLADTFIPPELHTLFTSQDDVGKAFRENIRAYNTNFAFASMGVSLDETVSNMRAGVYTFRVHKGIYHHVDQLVSRDGTPRYLQLYFYDPDTELRHRLEWPNLDRTITEMLTRALSENPYALTFRRLAELGPLDNYRVTLNASVELDQRVYNRPTTSEVAGIWVEGNDNITAFNRSIVVYGRSDYKLTIQPHFGCYNPLSYPLFFPNGESGWHPRIPRHGTALTETPTNVGHLYDDTEETPENGNRNTVTMREYYCYKFQIRPGENTILLGGRLTQQFTVDVYIKLETSRLQFCQLNQTRIRADLYQGIVDCVNAGDVRPTQVGKRIVLPASFIGGPRDMRRRFLDAMTLVQDDGKPDIFLTMTCNPHWPEIRDNLKPGQTAQDRPDLVSRVFRAKIEDLKEQLFKKHILGAVKDHVHVIEFQKRGLPHAHFLLVMYPHHKIHTPDQYDTFVCAEIPHPQTHPLLHNLVVTHMMHGPCGHLRVTSPCMQGEKKTCRFRYPKQFNENTTKGEDAYPLYRRRDTGMQVTVRNSTLDNRWVVPYNPKLLMMFNSHINLEICSSIKSVKYLYKYVYKGHDKQVIQVDPDAHDTVINEIKRYQDARYVCAPEALWRTFSFPLSQIHPPVLALQLHLPNNHMVRFTTNDVMSDVVERERGKKTMLTAFFEKNQSDTSLAYLYRDFPKFFTWNGRLGRWNRRTRKTQRGRIVSANPAEGERYYLRLLLTHVRGPTSFEDLRTVNGVKHTTFRKAALEMGLIDDDTTLSQCLQEAAVFKFPRALRRLFAIILKFCRPGDVRQLWTTHYDNLSEDHRRNSQNHSHIQDMVVNEIGEFLHSMGKTLQEFDLPRIAQPMNFQTNVQREIEEEYGIVVDQSHLQAQHSLNSDQKYVFDKIMTHVNSDLPGVFFVDGPGGTGKTFLYKALLAEVRSRGLLALATASSGAAANNMPGGRTAHSRFNIPIHLDTNSTCNIPIQTGTAALIRLARLIIWDEASMAKRQAIEALDRTMQDIMGSTLPFGGKLMLMGGDFRQVLPVVKRATRAQIVDASFRMSPLWSSTEKLRLSINMRALNDPWFSEFLLRVGDGSEETTHGNFIKIPDAMTIPFTTNDNSIRDLINIIYPSLDSNTHSPDYISSRAILTTRNDSVDEVNDYMINIFNGDERVYYSFDTTEDDHHNLYPVEFLNSLTVGGLPPHKLRLKIGCPIILLRNLNPSDGLCNGTRLVCKGFQPNAIDVEIAVGEHVGKRVLLPRIPLSLSEEDMFPFKLIRRQFPIRLSFSMTINKAQGQTIPNVGIYLPEPVFCHGQLYVALSRGTSMENTKVLVHPSKKIKAAGVFTNNVVYREILLDQ